MAGLRETPPPPPGAGHNNGPSMEAGRAWRVHCWTRARAARPEAKLPLPIVRMRIARAQELGLPYKTYASVRAVSGRDVAALLFTSNALRLFREGALPEDRRAALEAVRHCLLAGLIHPPLAVTAAEPLAQAARAPGLFHGWTETRDMIAAAHPRLPGPAVLLIGETALEETWAAAGRLAGYLEGAGYFGPETR